MTEAGVMADIPEGAPAGRSRDGCVLVLALAAFALWLAAIGPLRAWSKDAGVRIQWAFGVAPSFFAGLTWALWQAFVTRTGPVVSALYAVALITLAEAVQLFLPRYRADVWDVVAGMAGAAVALPILFWRARAG